MIESSQVSVIIPAYRAQRTIARAVDSVLAQTAAPGEIIVVDDGSPDALAASMAAYGPSVTLLRQANGGAASARNAGIECAGGEILAFLDADDYWAPEKLAWQLRIFNDHPEVGVVASRANTMDPGGPVVGPRADHAQYFNRVVKAEGLEAFNLARVIWTSTVAVRRAALGRERFMPGLEPAEDRDLWVRLASRRGVYLIDRALATGVLESGSLSRSSVERDCSNMLRVVHRHGQMLGLRGRRSMEAMVYRRWAAGLLFQGRASAALGPALRRLRRQCYSAQAWWVVAKCLVLAPVSRRHSWGAEAEASKGPVHA